MGFSGPTGKRKRFKASAKKQGKSAYHCAFRSGAKENFTVSLLSPKFVPECSLCAKRDTADALPTRFAYQMDPVRRLAYRTQLTTRGAYLFFFFFFSFFFPLFFYNDPCWSIIPLFITAAATAAAVISVNACYESL